ncbi:tripartite tricarboxylate transporter substrate binding protein [Ramlibacter sp. AW1]|uniref:Tripartite tricarboxylate transporter substrate binding protein n=1 Tax=Ramlibacter aurantiacus TaxID=2801330 RepID=A0A936ZYE4_9BURK|nr:tripartite tricarboxylate transporter substrate binding protein [Ramlibacter aurantiacus]MBL0423345.1 tripartite tricarboxylate transporter substrate binding protein [Ramlibacter aurantiacus]
MKPIDLVRRAATLLTLLAAVGASHAQGYPTKPIHVVFPYPPGSPPDAIGRLIADKASKILGQPLVFENRPGANGILGTGQVARATPDGYTIHLNTTSGFLLNSFVRKDLAYDPVKNFTPIIALADIPVALMTSARVPASNTREFVQYLKQNPGKLNYASVGNGSFNHLFMEQLKAAAGVDLVHVPYQGAGTIPAELMSGRIDATVLSVASVMGQWKAGQVKVLAMMSSKRSPALPEVPAITETFSDFRPFTNWIGFLAPAGTPAPIVARLNEAFRAVLQQPDVLARIEQQQWTPIGGTPEDFKASIAADMKVIGDAVGSAGIKPE